MNESLYLIHMNADDGKCKISPCRITDTVFEKPLAVTAVTESAVYIGKRMERRQAGKEWMVSTRVSILGHS